MITNLQPLLKDIKKMKIFNMRLSFYQLPYMLQTYVKLINYFYLLLFEEDRLYYPTQIPKTKFIKC